VHKLNALFIALILFLILGCENKNTSTDTIPMENTTEVLQQNTHGSSDTDRFKIQSNTHIKHTDTPSSIHLSDTFTLSDIKGTSYTATVSNRKMTFKETKKAIVLVTFFSTWCIPCVHDIPYMNDLHKKYNKNILLVGVLVHDSIAEEQLHSFLAKHLVSYFVSTSKENNDFASLVAKTLRLPKDFSIPLTVMYVEGEYFTHYEGCVPVEMIDYDIQQALEMLKK